MIPCGSLLLIEIIYVSLRNHLIVDLLLSDLLIPSRLLAQHVSTLTGID